MVKLLATLPKSLSEVFPTPGDDGIGRKVFPPDQRPFSLIETDAKELSQKRQAEG